VPQFDEERVPALLSAGVALALAEGQTVLDLVRETDTVGDRVFVAIPVGSVLVMVAELHREVDLV